MRSRCLPLVLAFILLASIIPQPISADTVIRAEAVELLPAGDFSTPSEWSLSTNKAYSEDSAEYTVAMIADDHLSFTHDRPENHGEFISWATYSPTESNYSLGEPDGSYSWSKGPTIDLEGFDMSQAGSNQIINASVVVAFRIPEALQQDSVNIILESDGTQHLLKTYAHTPSGINYMQNNEKYLEIDSISNWTWAELSDATIIIDYVSVGGTDDSEVQVDAAGIWARYIKPWGTFEMAKATHSVTVENSPLLVLDLVEGTHHDLTISPCGLENSNANSGVWTSTTLHRPYDQNWGRLHPTVSGNSSWKVGTPMGAETWTWTSIQSGDLLPDSDQIRLEGTLIDGCIEGVRVDINDPTFTVSGSITGSIDSMVSEAAFIRFAMNGEAILSFDFQTGAFSYSAPVGHLIPVSGGIIDVGASTRFYWSSDGSAESLVVNIDEMKIEGGFVIDWDLDPVCEGIPNQSFDEDAGGRLIDFLYTCSDDLTANENLVVNVASSNPDILEANFVNGQIRMQPLSNAHGSGTVHITVSDVRGNTWVDIVDFIITPIDDSPEMELLPISVLVEVGIAEMIPFSFTDLDTPSSELTVTISPSWVTYSGGNLIIDPPISGSYTMTISIDDGTTQIDQSMVVTATRKADLLVQSLDFRILVGEPDNLTTGDIVIIDVFVENDGDSTAQPVSVRCKINGAEVGRGEIAMISPNGLDIGSCDWIISQVGIVELTVEVDWTLDIDESNELNNIFSTNLTIGDGVEVQDISTSSDEGPVLSSMMIWTLAIVMIVLSILFLQIGPNKIRKIE